MRLEDKLYTALGKLTILVKEAGDVVLAYHLVGIMKNPSISSSVKEKEGVVKMEEEEGVKRSGSEKPPEDGCCPICFGNFSSLQNQLCSLVLSGMSYRAKHDYLSYICKKSGQARNAISHCVINPSSLIFTYGA
ncbi:uncharacterized protein LOC132598654 isoform X2 [Lycium barbarum]|uniref:uncharacterized protein LOC132598654 isoform X2 n=1 Tax=Lycium barbarum TaxID=112863 RepID=UPI00293EEF4B|nr:uncharacterized protein LOC132598654 isoform X2 [Lycium barbarum]